MLYAGDLTFGRKIFEGVKVKPDVWKVGLESKEMWVNVGRTKMMTSSQKASKVRKEDKVFFVACRKGVGCNCMLCQFCNCWARKKYIGIRGSL